MLPEPTGNETVAQDSAHCHLGAASWINEVRRVRPAPAFLQRDVAARVPPNSFAIAPCSILPFPTFSLGYTKWWGKVVTSPPLN